MSDNVFFGMELSQKVLSKFLLKFESMSSDDDFELSRNSMIKLVVNSMIKNSNEWDKNCQINIEWIGDSFINRLDRADIKNSKENIDNIAASCFRFLFELFLSTKPSLEIEFEDSRMFVINNIDSFEGKAKEQIKFAIQQMPIRILKSVANSDEINSIKDFNILSKKAENLKADWDKDIAEKLGEAKVLKEELTKYKTAFNFVGLYQGFDDLSKEKEEEKSNILFWLKILGVIITLPLIFELIVISLHIDNLDKVKNVILISFAPVASLVAISIYYFRVLLFNYKSVKSQLLQIALRKTLCRFIQNYADYSKELKDKGQEPLDKFENIIFSGIVSDDGALPSTYDGLEQIGKLLKSVRS